MIKEVISSILEAEKNADNIIKEANISALKMYTDAKKRAEEINKEAKEEMHTLAEKTYTLAGIQGDKEAANVINKGKEAADALTKILKEKYDKAEEYILRRLFET